MKIYTKTGDSGTTGLFAGPRVPKDHPRISAYGTVDELNALLGVVGSSMSESTQQDPIGAVGFTLEQLVRSIQSDLFSIGAELATPEPEDHGMCLLTEERITYLEHAIDEVEGALEPLSNFVLPGGSRDSAMFHLARTVCRRAEREVVHLAHQPDVHDCSTIVVYLNRLSDLLFVMARLANRHAGIPDLPWHRPAKV
jgi:cob(I)alamin adenosyltransferase